MKRRLHLNRDRDGLMAAGTSTAHGTDTVLPPKNPFAQDKQPRQAEAQQEGKQQEGKLQGDGQQGREQCPCCADLDIRNPVEWQRSTSRFRDGFEHKSCRRYLERQDLVRFGGNKTGPRCAICSVFLAAVEKSSWEPEGGPRATIEVGLFFDNESADGIFSAPQHVSTPPLHGQLQACQQRLLAASSLEETAALEAELAVAFFGGRAGPLLSGTAKVTDQPDTNQNTKAIRRRPEFSPTVRADTVLSFIKAHLETCLREHGAPCEQRPPPTLPCRVIEVGMGTMAETDGDDIIRLRETNSVTTGRYIALSYCWGNGNSVTTTASTIKQLKSGISRRMLPRTLQDAVEFTRELGIPYLWIDALCIIQDSASDWETESAKMGDIYNSAFLTVAASSASSAAGGFLRRHQEPAELKVKWPDGVTARARIGPPGLLSPLDSEPWYRRGWTFQEQLLSTRLVIYSDREVQWACPSVRACECGGNDGAKNLTPQTYEDHFPTALWQLADRAKAPDFWVNLVNSYSARSLTVERDRLPALSGIASRIGRLTESSYLAGLWAGDVLSGLCWSRRVPAAVGASPGTYRAPTFSWASVDGPIHYFHRDRGRDAKEPNLAPQSIDASTTVDGLNPFGVVTEGWIKIRASIMPCTVQGQTAFLKDGGQRHGENFSPDMHLGGFSYRDGNGNTQTSAARLSSLSSAPNNSSSPGNIASLSFNSDSSTERFPAWLLYIGCRNYGYDTSSHGRPTMIHLVLGKSPRNPEVYERLGLLVASPSFPIPVSEDSTETVTIV